MLGSLSAGLPHENDTAPGILEKIVKIVVSYVDIPKALAFDIAIEIRDTIEADRLSAGKLQDC